MLSTVHSDTSLGTVSVAIGNPIYIQLQAPDGNIAPEPFIKPMQLTMYVSESDLAAAGMSGNVSDLELSIWRFNEDLLCWERVGRAFNSSSGSVFVNIDRSGTYVVAGLSDNFNTNGLSVIKSLADGKRVLISSQSAPVVTAVFPDCFYVESIDRTVGMRVQSRSSASVKIGDRVAIEGVMSTTTLSERYIEAIRVSVVGSGLIMPLGMVGKSVGGSDANIATFGLGQRGVQSGIGPNNVGLLVKCWGKVLASGQGFFYIDDGSNVSSGSIYRGLRVDCGSLIPPKLGSFVAVTGISTLRKSRGNLYPVIRMRSLSDLSIFSDSN